MSQSSHLCVTFVNEGVLQVYLECRVRSAAGEEGDGGPHYQPTLWVSIKLFATHSEKERQVTAGRDIIHNFKRYFVVKIIKSSTPGADRGKFMILHSWLDQCLQWEKKK